MNQHYRAAGALNHEVQVSAINIDEGRLSVSMVMSNTRSDITPLESAGDAHVID